MVISIRDGQIMVLAHHRPKNGVWGWQNGTNWPNMAHGMPHVASPMAHGMAHVASPMALYGPPHGW